MTSNQRQGMLAMATDLHIQLQFPAEVAVTGSCPDIVLWSTSPKQVAMLELTVPWEKRMEEANERKRSKYQQVVEVCPT